MSLSYRLVDDTYARHIWEREQSAPEWFRDASNVWHDPDFDSFMEHFWKKATEVWGLFDDQKLLACVYLQFLSAIEVNIHVSVIEKVKPAALIRFFASLKNKKALDGVQVMTGWLLDKNRGLREIGELGGFVPTGLTMQFGASHGKPLTWVQVRG